jgi:hypothetical protein
MVFIVVIEPASHRRAVDITPVRVPIPPPTLSGFAGRTR